MEEEGEECGVSQMLRLVHGGQVDRLRAIIGGAGDVAELCTTSGEDGWSVFTLAADLGNAEVVQLLCDARVPVNQPNKVGIGHDIRSYLFPIYCRNGNGIHSSPGISNGIFP